MEVFNTGSTVRAISHLEDSHDLNADGVIVPEPFGGTITHHRMSPNIVVCRPGTARYRGG